MTQLRVVLVKPSKYAVDGSVERFKKGFLPNATLYHIASLTPARIGDVPVTVHTVDEYVWTDLDYLRWLHHDPDAITLVALVGVQSHQFHRALDLAAYARHHGVRHCVIGGPHAMTCDTSLLQGRGVSFALAEAELIWQQILDDALAGELQPLYGRNQRWAEKLPGTVINPPSTAELARYTAPMLGLYPVRGCPYQCNFCSVIKISGRQVRSPDIESTLESLRRAKRGGVETIIFVSDNFNKFPSVRELLRAMIDERFGLPFFCQCDTQIARDPELVELLGRAGCCEMYVGAESFNRKTLKAAGKHHNHPEQYVEIIRLCRQATIRPHFGNIIGFPNDDEEEIRHHLDVLKELRPTVASFFILTPIPGTEQYDDFRKAGLITERNLDRFDATCPTWSHPILSAKRLEDLLYQCYVSYYGFLLKSGGLSIKEQQQAIYHRYTAAQRTHPMAGGVDRLRLDTAADYAALRRAVYDIDLVPLPDSLSLSGRDEALNRRIDWRVQRPVEHATS
ncbi:MAG: radical SAM protein [Betaproteobacteria bacterium]|nr:radical SAM protein [Betaproteobacteria bacterium]MBI3056083.1 radical SAM protein [Betaproteobacteria bacterium]